MQPTRHDEIHAELARRLDWRRRINRTAKSDAYFVPLKPLPRIVCADGFSMSVQAGDLLYCTPRQSRAQWTEVEVGFPSERVEQFMPYIHDDPDTVDPTHTVYGYVPMETVVEVIAEHGGYATDAPTAGRRR